MLRSGLDAWCEHRYQVKRERLYICCNVHLKSAAEFWSKTNIYRADDLRELRKGKAQAEKKKKALPLPKIMSFWDSYIRPQNLKNTVSETEVTAVNA